MKIVNSIQKMLWNPEHETDETMELILNFIREFAKKQTTEEFFVNLSKVVPLYKAVLGFFESTSEKVYYITGYSFGKDKVTCEVYTADGLPEPYIGTTEANRYIVEFQTGNLSVLLDEKLEVQFV